MAQAVAVNPNRKLTVIGFVAENISKSFYLPSAFTNEALRFDNK